MPHASTRASGLSMDITRSVTRTRQDADPNIAFRMATTFPPLENDLMLRAARGVQLLVCQSCQID